MYLFSRRGRLSGSKLHDSLTWAATITERVNQSTGLQVSLWTGMFSPQVGTLVWATFVPDLATIEAANDKLMVDDAYNDLTDKGFEYCIPGSFDDGLATIVAGDPDPSRQVEYVARVQTSISAGKLADGMALGVEIAHRAQAITGVPTLFVSEATGNYGGVAWLTGFANIGELERAQQALSSDTSFVKFLDSKTKGVYAEAMPAAQTVLRRIPTS